MRAEREGTKKGESPGGCDGCRRLLCAPHPPKLKATHRSPTAMFAGLQWQAGLRGHARMSVMRANHLPTSMTQWLFDSPSLVYRCGGSAGFGSVKRLKHAPASRFTRRRSRSNPKTPAKHL